MPATSPCVSLREQIATLQRTLDALKKKLVEDNKRHDVEQAKDDERGIAIAEAELDELGKDMVANGCYDHSPPPPQPPKLTLILLPPAIHPGEHLRFRWGFSYALKADTYGIGDKVTAQLFAGDIFRAPADKFEVKLWEQTDIAFPPTDLFSFAPALGGIVTITPSAALAPTFYKTPGLGITLRIDGNGLEGPYDTSVSLKIQKMPIDSAWWRWTVPDHDNKSWKADDYLLSGILTNESAADMVGATLVLMEIEDGKPATSITTLAAVRMAPAAPFIATYPPLAKKWEFISAPLWKINGPMLKIFEYYVTFAFSQDIYGNIYGEPVDTSRVTIVVQVPAKNAAAAFAAQAAAITAAIFAAAAAAAFAGFFTAPAAPALLSIAEEFYLIASAAGVVAMDPPTPDPQYREAIVVPHEHNHGGQNAFPAVHQFFTLLRYTLELEQTRLSLPGRLMAARYFNDLPMAALHAQTHQSVLEQMFRTIARLRTLAAAAKDELARHLPIPAQLLAEVAALARAGTLHFPDETKAIEREHFLVLLTDSETMERAVTLGLSGTIDRIVQAMVDLAAFVPRVAL
jgi:DNA-binding FrmR family transcriptional regulator